MKKKDAKLMLTTRMYKSISLSKTQKMCKDKQ